jgi:hypothetical protein
LANSTAAQKIEQLHRTRDGRFVELGVATPRATDGVETSIIDVKE